MASAISVFDINVIKETYVNFYPTNIFQRYNSPYCLKCAYITVKVNAPLFR